MRLSICIVLGISLLLGSITLERGPRVVVAQTPNDLTTIDLGLVQFSVPRTWEDHGTDLNASGASKAADYRSPDGAQSVRLYIDRPLDGTTAMSYLQNDFDNDLYESGRRWLASPMSTHVAGADEAAIGVEQYTWDTGEVRDIAAIVAMRDGFVEEFILYFGDGFAASHPELIASMLSSFSLSP